MTPNPIHKVLSTMREFDVRSLLMGGQACVFYGAAEFSRDTDLVLLAEPDNLARLHKALQYLHATTIAVPPFERSYLERGHAIHFRCRHPEALDMRIDVMAVLRGLPDFQALWERRTSIEVPPHDTFELLALPDLVQAKKTQRDKDWPMIRRLIEADVVTAGDTPDEQRVQFWFREARTPALLIALGKQYPDMLSALREQRPLLNYARDGSEDTLEKQLRDEEDRERALDRAYWLPLRQELEHLRHSKAHEDDDAV